MNFGEPVTITDLGNGRVWAADGGEISGFGGAYEDHCRKMLKGALEWLDANPSADPAFKGWKGIHGVIVESNKDALALTKAIEVAGNHDLTGAMHHAVVNCAIFIKARGWDEFVKLKKEVAEKEAAKERESAS